MAVPTRCPRSDCDGQEFEVRETKVLGSNWNHRVIQCAKCGAAVVFGSGGQQEANLMASLAALSDKFGVRLQKLEEKLNHLLAAPPRE
jgi:hypothetical protein